LSLFFHHPLGPLLFDVLESSPFHEPADPPSCPHLSPLILRARESYLETSPQETIAGAGAAADPVLRGFCGPVNPLLFSLQRKRFFDLPPVFAGSSAGHCYPSPVLPPVILQLFFFHFSLVSFVGERPPSGCWSWRGAAHEFPQCVLPFVHVLKNFSFLASPFLMTSVLNPPIGLRFTAKPTRRVVRLLVFCPCGPPLIPEAA